MEGDQFRNGEKHLRIGKRFARPTPKQHHLCLEQVHVLRYAIHSRPDADTMDDLLGDYLPPNDRFLRIQHNVRRLFIRPENVHIASTMIIHLPASPITVYTVQVTFNFVNINDLMDTRSDA